ncbi:MAG: LutC/YkgG family protein [Candidatus Kryptoniota bacterium]
MNDSREKIFASIRRGLRGSEPFAANRDDRSPLKAILKSDFDSLFEKFSKELGKIGGKAVTLNDEESAAKFIVDRAGDNIFTYEEPASLRKSLSSNAKTQTTIKGFSDFDFGYDKREVSLFDSAVSPCTACIVETGTVMVVNKMRLPAALATKLFVVAEPEMLIPSLDELFIDKYKNHKVSNIFLITGPSRTADIEKVIVTGVHGPKEVYVIFILGNRR